MARWARRQTQAGWGGWGNVARIRMIEHVWKTGARWAAVGLLLLAVGCGDGSPTAPTPGSGSPTVTVSCDPCEVTFGEQSRLRADVSDPAGGPLTYRWTVSAGVMGPYRAATWWYAPDQPGPVSIQVTVTNGRGGSASDTVTIQVSPPPTRPVEAQFDGRFWRQFVFNQLERPGTVGRQVSWVLETTSPNVYIRMGDPTGRRVVSIGQRDHMRRAIPRLAEQLTGEPYRGRIEHGIADRERRGWITVRFVTEEEEPDISEGACGRASIGGDPGNIWIIRRARGNKRCTDERFPELFAHEVGHALGFYHVVPDRNSIMAPGVYYGIEQFSAREVYHARLAYEVGRGQRYCGWPFRATCFPRTALGAPTFRPGPPVIVID